MNKQWTDVYITTASTEIKGEARIGREWEGERRKASRRLRRRHSAAIAAAATNELFSNKIKMANC